MSLEDVMRGGAYPFNIKINEISVNEILKEKIIKNRIIGFNYNSLINPYEKQCFSKIKPYELLIDIDETNVFDVDSNISLFDYFSMKDSNKEISEKDFLKESVNKNSQKTKRLILSAGVSSKELLKYSQCFYSLDTVPGTIGGLIYNNASCSKCISDYLESVLYGVCNDFNETLTFKRISKRECEFSARNSLFRKLEGNYFAEDSLKNFKKVVILEASFIIPLEYTPSKKEIENYNIKVSQLEYFNNFRNICYENSLEKYVRDEFSIKNSNESNKNKSLIDNYPISSKGCIYCDHFVNVLLRELKWNGTIRNNIKIDERWPIYWIPLKECTYKDWTYLINTINILYYLKYNKLPYMEIELI